MIVAATFAAYGGEIQTDPLCPPAAVDVASTRYAADGRFWNVATPFAPVVPLATTVSDVVSVSAPFPGLRERVCCSTDTLAFASGAYCEVSLPATALPTVTASVIDVAPVTGGVVLPVSPGEFAPPPVFAAGSGEMDGDVDRSWHAATSVNTIAVAMTNQCFLPCSM
jgi:hypothetical protein